MDENTTQQNGQEQGNGGRRRRRRPRRRGGVKGPMAEVQGYLWMRDNGSPLMVAAERNFVADRSDPMVPIELVRPMHLESGLLIGGKARGGDRPRLTEIDMVEGLTPEDYRAKAIPFTELIS